MIFDDYWDDAQVPSEYRHIAKAAWLSGSRDRESETLEVLESVQQLEEERDALRLALDRALDGMRERSELAWELAKSLRDHKQMACAAWLATDDDLLARSAALGVWSK